MGLYSAGLAKIYAQPDYDSLLAALDGFIMLYGKMTFSSMNGQEARAEMLERKARAFCRLTKAESGRVCSRSRNHLIRGINARLRNINKTGPTTWMLLENE